MSKRVIIGITGKIGCGKSTASDILEEMKFKQYSLAGPLKEIAMNLGFKYDEVYGTQEDKLTINDFWGISGRRFMQIFGSEICRDILPNVLPEMKLNDKSIWIRLFEKYITDVKNNIVVTDVRFANEAQSIKDLGGYIIKLERFHETDSHNITNDHQSETQNDIKYNFVIRNDGSIEDLKKNIRQTLNYINNGIADINNSIIYI